MENNFQKGDHVFVGLVAGKSFEGEIVNFKESLTITLKNVIQHPENLKLEGFRYFEYSEITKVVKVPSSAEKENLSNNVTQDKELESELESVFKNLRISGEEYDSIIELQQTYRYIKNFDNNFYGAISLLQKASLIGFCCKDVSRGRGKRASLVGISTESNIFIFDLELMGDRVFDKGLKDILESPNVVKVVYDCRNLSDCLSHKHAINLHNVRDVEAEDVVLVHQQRGVVRKHTRKVSYLIERYLGIPDPITEDENNGWSERPLSLHLQKSLARYLSFLIPLQKVIEENYNRRLIDVSEIYNRVIKNGDDYQRLINIVDKYTCREEIAKLVEFKREART